MTGAGWGQSGYVGGQGPWGYGSHPISILALCDLRTNASMAWASGVTPHVHTGLGQVCAQCASSAPRTSPTGVVIVGPSDFLFTAAADSLSSWSPPAAYLLLRIVTRHNVGTSAVNGSSFSTLKVPDAFP